MPSDFPDALKQYKKFKSMGGAFVFAKNGSTFDFQIHPKVMIPRIKAIARESKGQIIAGKWSFEGGKTNFEITFKKGKLTLNDDVRRRMKNGLELSVQPIVFEGSDVEDEDTVVNPEAPTTDTPSAPKVAGVDETDFAGLGALDSMLGGMKQKVDEATSTAKREEIDGLSEDSFDLGGLDFIEQVDQQTTFTGSIRDISTARLAWVQAEKSAEKLLRGLSADIIGDFPDEKATADGVLKALDKVGGEDLVDRLDDLYNAKGKDDAAAIDKAHAAALKAVADYRKAVKSDPVLKHINDAPYDKGRKIIDALEVGLKGIEENLKAMVGTV